MVRYHLIDFFNKHILIQRLLFIFIFILFTIYTVFLSFDLYNVVTASVLNCEIIKNDSTTVELDSYELDGTTLTLGKDVYEDVNIVFYGIATNDATVYFSEDSNTLVQSLPKDFGFKFLLGSNAFLMLASLGVLIMLTGKRNSSLIFIQQSNIRKFFIGLFIILVIISVFALMLLC